MTDGTTSTHHARAIIGLLIGIAVLLAVQVGELTYGAYAALQKAQALKDEAGGAQGASAAARRASEELTQRQDAIAASLAEITRRTSAEIKVLKERRKALEDISGGPLKKAEVALNMTLLMSDMMFTMMDNIVGEEQVMAKGVRPLPTQRDVTATPTPAGAAAVQEKKEERGRQKTEARRGQPPKRAAPRPVVPAAETK